MVHNESEALDLINLFSEKKQAEKDGKDVTNLQESINSKLYV